MKVMSVEDVILKIKRQQPVILVLQAWTDMRRVNWKHDWVDGHYVVAIGYDDKHIYFEDPSSFMRTYLSFKELDERWHDVDAHNKKIDHVGVLISKPWFHKMAAKPVHMD